MEPTQSADMVADAEAFLEGLPSDGADAAEAEKVESTEAEPAPDEEAGAEDNPAEVDEPEDGEPEEDPAEVEGEEAEGSSETQDETPKKMGRWAKNKKARQEAEARADKAEATLAEYEKNQDELFETSQWFAEQYDAVKAQAQSLQAENARLKARLGEFDIPEWESAESQQVAQLRHEIESLKAGKAREEKNAEIQKQAQAQANLQRQAQDLATELRKASEAHGVKPQELLKAFAAAKSLDPKETPESVAQQLSRLKGIQQKVADAHEQAQVNGSAPKPVGGKSGVNQSKLFSNDVDGAMRYLDHINGR